MQSRSHLAVRSDTGRHSAAPDGAAPRGERRILGPLWWDECRARWRDERGSIAILSALSLVSLTGATAMALDLSQLYLIQSIDQRIADASALAAALAYNQTGSLTTAQNAATSLATVNGAAGASIPTPTLVTLNGNPAIKVVVTSTVSLSPFGQISTTSSINPSGLLSVTVSATAYAQIQANPGPCVIALDTAGQGVIGGHSFITATGCAVYSNTTINASSGGTSGGVFTAQAVYAVGTMAGSITTSPTAGNTHTPAAVLTDPFAGAGVFSRITSVGSLTAPGFPAVGSAPSGGSTKNCTGTLTLNAGTYSTIGGSNPGTCTITFTGGSETDISGSGINFTNNTLNLTFNAGTYKINGFTLAGGTGTITTVGNVTFDIWNGISIPFGNNTCMTFNGPATYNIQGGINIQTSCAGGVKFTNGGGSSLSTFNVTGAVSITQGTVIFPDGTYDIVNSSTLTSALNVANSSTVTFGNGSFIIAGNKGGLYLNGGASLTFGSSLDSSSVFEILRTGTGTGTAINNAGGFLRMGSFANHDLNGDFTAYMVNHLGAGTYTVTGSLSTCGTAGTFDGSGVSVIAAGTLCLGADLFNLSAPATIDATSSGTPPTVVLAAQSAVTSSVTTNAASTVVGAIYVPSAPLSFVSPANLSGNGGCLEVVAGGMTLSSTSYITTTCPPLGGSTSGTVALAQ